MYIYTYIYVPFIIVKSNYPFFFLAIQADRPQLKELATRWQSRKQQLGMNICRFGRSIWSIDFLTPTFVIFFKYFLLNKRHYYSGDECQNSKYDTLLTFFESAENMDIADSPSEYQDNSSVDTSSGGGFNHYTVSFNSFHFIE
jgi:hypothetical protein